jgi:predicted DNA binding CopG/RHH family protein
MRPIEAPSTSTSLNAFGETMPKSKPMTRRQREAEAAFAKKAFDERAELNRKARKAILAASGSRQVTIRLSDAMLATARQQAQTKGLPYQTYIKMLLHEALINAAK